MEAERFDRVTRLVMFEATRRGALGAIFASTFSLLSLPETLGKKRKRKKKKRNGCRGGCPAGAICSGKVCVYCASGELACGNTCVSSNDRASCGACGNACPAGSICQSGVCVFCASDMTQCGNSCVNLVTDPANCRRCGHVCSKGACLNGVCGCTASADCESGCQCITVGPGGPHCLSGFTSPCNNGKCPLGELCQLEGNLCVAACPG